MLYRKLRAVLIVVTTSILLTLMCWTSGLVFIMIFILAIFQVPIDVQSGPNLVPHPIFGNKYFMPFLSWVISLCISGIGYHVIRRMPFGNRSASKPKRNLRDEL
jgi:hypothetical protein